MADDTNRVFRPDKPATGNWISIGHPAVAEICSEGFGFVVIDMEHTAMGLETVEDLVRAVHADTAPLVRVPSSDPVRIKRVLDLGVAGVVIPKVETAEQAQQAVDTMQYPPEGTRGVAPARASDYGRTFDEYVETADDKLETVIQIETERGVENADEILSVDGVDAVIIGHGDLSASLEVFGQWDDDRFVSALNTILSTARDSGTAVGMLATDHESIHRWTDAGVDFLVVGADITYLSAGSDTARTEFEDLVGEDP